MNEHQQRIASQTKRSIEFDKDKKLFSEFNLWKAEILDAVMSQGLDALTLNGYQFMFAWQDGDSVEYVADELVAMDKAVRTLFGR